MPDTLNLSESAVATLRLRMKGLRLPVTDRRLAAYRELAAAGIMEPADEGESEFRFTGWGIAHREEILDREWERIERERYAPPDGRLSTSARALLRRIASGERVEVDEASRPDFRELAAARFVVLGHSFARGDESAYRFTYWGWKRKDEWIAGAREIA